MIIDFDSALSIGERLVKGVAASNKGISDRDNDYRGLSIIREFLTGSVEDAEV